MTTPNIPGLYHATSGFGYKTVVHFDGMVWSARNQPVIPPTTIASCIGAPVTAEEVAKLAEAARALHQWIKHAPQFPDPPDWATEALRPFVEERDLA